MNEDEGSAILATSILASFRPLSSLKRLAKLFASNRSSKCPFTPVTDDSFRGAIRSHKSEARASNGSSRTAPNKCTIRPQVLASRKEPSVTTSHCCGSDRSADGALNLVKFDEVPAYLQFNQYVLNGYRPPNLTVSQCLASLLYFHNETINIMTHGEIVRPIIKHH